MTSFVDGHMDSILDSATVDGGEPSPQLTGQEPSEDRGLKSTSNSPKERAPSPKDTCSGKTQKV